MVGGDDTSSIMSLELYLPDPFEDQIRFDSSVVWANILRGKAPRGQQTVFLVRLMAILNFVTPQTRDCKICSPRNYLGSLHCPERC